MDHWAVPVVPVARASPEDSTAVLVAHAAMVEAVAVRVKVGSKAAAVRLVGGGAWLRPNGCC